MSIIHHGREEAAPVRTDSASSEVYMNRVRRIYALRTRGFGSKQLGRVLLRVLAIDEWYSKVSRSPQGPVRVLLHRSPSCDNRTADGRYEK